MTKNDDYEPERTSRNVMIDTNKDTFLEEMRIINKGMSTECRRGRSDVYNEVISYGIEIIKLKRDIGDKDFEKTWSLLHKINLQKVDISKLI
jgi:hypothetical protein